VMKLSERCEHGFVYETIAGCGLYSAPQFKRTGLVKHGFTSRIGGVSEAPFDTLNMGLRRPDAQSNLRENYRRVCAALHIDADALTCVNYAHGPNVALPARDQIGAGVFKPDLPFECDGIVTNRKDTALLTLHADCLPVFLLDEAGVIGLCHAGWRGVEGGIIEKTFEKMQTLGSRAQNCYAAIGPGIARCCFEVDAPVAELFLRFGMDVVRPYGEKYKVDLYEITVRQLAALGFEPKRVTLFDGCTCCDEAHFFSARRDKGKTGAMAALMQLV
jgi:YfiH family protein